MYLSESSKIGTQTNLDTLMQFEQSENYDPSFLANVSELRYVDAVRTLVRTRIFKKHILFMVPNGTEGIIFCYNSVYE